MPYTPCWRITIAYLLSLIFTLVYGYIAAYNAKAERFMVPLLDVLQSIPVLSFLPGVMLAMVSLFPSRQLGIEFRLPFCSFLRTGVEYGVQLLLVAQEHSHGNA